MSNNEKGSELGGKSEHVESRGLRISRWITALEASSSAASDDIRVDCISIVNREIRELGTIPKVVDLSLVLLEELIDEETPKETPRYQNTMQTIIGALELWQENLELKSSADGKLTDESESLGTSEFANDREAYKASVKEFLDRVFS